MNNELYHFGIKGQKWGIRRYQNEDGSLTAAGKARYDSGDLKNVKKEYKEDNKKAYELGKEATILGSASDKANAKLARTKVTSKKYSNRKETADILNERYAEKQKEAEAYYKELVGKYGKEAISSLKYGKNGKLNEATNNGADYVRSAAITIGATALGHLPQMLGMSYVGLTTISLPSTKGMKGAATYNAYYTTVKNKNNVLKKGGKYTTVSY